MAGFTDRNSNLPGRGDRVATFVEDYLRVHPGLTQSELSVRLRVDKRDIQRLIRDRSVGHRLEDALAGYFGQLFIDALFPPEHFGGRSIRERELAQELSELSARNQRLERERAERRLAQAETVRRMVNDKGRTRPF